MRVEIPDGQWAEIRGPETLTRKDEKHVLKASTVTIDPESRTVMTSGAESQILEDAMLARVITDWSFPHPLPIAQPGSLDLLSLDQAHALAEAVRPHLELITVKLDPGKKDSDPTAG